MKSTMSYMGYYGSVEFSDEDNVFYGVIIGINDHITYEGNSVKSLRRDFENAVEDYLYACSQIGKEPEKTYKGSFNVRIAPELHRELAIYSSASGRSLNSTVEEAIRSYIR